MLTLTQDIHDAIVAHCLADHPDEACGIVAGPFGSGQPQRFVPVLNAARSQTFHDFTSGALLRLCKETEERHEEPVVIYHSHTATEAYPSRIDVSWASVPRAHYVVVSTAECGDGHGPVRFRSFSIVEEQIAEEEVRIAPPPWPAKHPRWDEFMHCSRPY